MGFEMQEVATRGCHIGTGTRQSDSDTKYIRFASQALQLGAQLPEFPHPLRGWLGMMSHT